MQNTAEGEKMNYIYRQKGSDEMYKTWHSHDEYMIIYTYSSGGSIVTADATYPIKRGAIALIAPGKYHYTMPAATDSYVRTKLFISEDEARSIFGMLDFLDCPRGSLIYAVVPPEQRAKVEELLSDADAASRDKKYESAELTSAALRLAVYLDRFLADKELGSSDSMSLAVKFISDNITADIDIDSVAAAANMSKYHFCRSFKRALGATVMEYVLETRIMLAKNMLKASDASILTVSESCGFSSVSYFCRAFKAAVGKTPLGYRKAGKEAYNK